MRTLLITAASLALAACAAAADPVAPPIEASVEAELEGAPEPQMAPAESAELADAPEAADVVAEAAAAPDVRCRIRLTRTRHGMEFEAVARALDPASGDYEFVVTKEGSGGASDIMQGGAFDLDAGSSERLGAAELSLERGARYRSRLTLSDGDGVLCEDEVRS